MKNTALILLLCSASAGAQIQVPEGAPADSLPIGGEQLRARLAGKVFKFSAPGSAVTSRLQYNDNGYVYLNISTGLSDSAPWRIEGTQLCADWRKIPASCSEMRVRGDLLFSKRVNGTWGTLTPD